MDEPKAEIHQVGGQMIHLVREKINASDEYLGLIEGGGICLANSLPTAQEAEQWLQSMFARLYPGHECGLGCIGLPGSEFLASKDDLERLTTLEDARH
jgi:disulfide oxidoreductase YuzD